MTRLITGWFMTCAVVALLTCTSSYAGIIQDGLVGYWQFNQSGADSSGNNHEGTLYGDTSYVLQTDDASHFGYSVYFDGNYDYVSVPDHDDLDFTTAYTAILWIKPSSFASLAALIDKWINGGGSSRAYSIFMSNDDIRPYLTTDSSSSYHDFDAAADITVNVWQQIAVTYDGSHLSVFKDGEFVGQKSVSGEININDTHLLMGAYNGSSPNTVFNKEPLKNTSISLN